MIESSIKIVFYFLFRPRFSQFAIVYLTVYLETRFMPNRNQNVYRGLKSQFKGEFPFSCRTKENVGRSESWSTYHANDSTLQKAYNLGISDG